MHFAASAAIEYGRFSRRYAMDKIFRRDRGLKPTAKFICRYAARKWPRAIAAFFCTA